MRDIDFGTSAGYSPLTTFIGVRKDEEFEVTRAPELFRIEKVDSNIRLSSPQGP